MPRFRPYRAPETARVAALNRENRRLRRAFSELAAELRSAAVNTNNDHSWAALDWAARRVRETLLKVDNHDSPE